jgi:AAA+ ATPase superfamily predicted ATPase
VYTHDQRPVNPFTFGDFALDESFTDREEEVAELVSDMRNGQNVLVYAPRRYGKSSLVLSAASKAVEAGVLVSYVDLMKTPTKERLAAALAKSIFEDVMPLSEQIAERAGKLFGGLRVKPILELDPVTQKIRFTFEPSRHRRDPAVDETIEGLLDLLQHLASEQRKRVVLILDEFQEIVRLDKGYPNLLRAIFQAQPEVAHLYLGSKRHVIDTIFSDRNEPFWRSAKRLELDVIPKEMFKTFIERRFADTDKGVTADSLDRIVDATNGHPYATQELCYFVWELVPFGHHALGSDVETALAQVLRSEHNHFSRIWEDATENQRLLLLALAEEPSTLYSPTWQARHGLESSSHVQRAAGTLERHELIGKNPDGEYEILEPFLAEWLRGEQARPPAVDELRRS